MTEEHQQAPLASFDAPALSSDPKEAYFQLLRVWVQQAHLAQNASACFPYYLMANYPQLYMTSTGLMTSQNQLPGGTFPNIPGEQPNQRLGFNNWFNRNPLRQEDFTDNPIRSTEIINQNGGYEYVIAPLWKRFVAEGIDIVLLFIMKLVFAFMLIDIFEFDFGFDFESLRNSIDEDYTEFIFFSTEMIYIELITKFIVCVYEALYTRHGTEQIGGATLGKMIMKLRILYVEAVVPLPAAPQPEQIPGVVQRPPPLRALIFPAQNLGFRRAMLRAVAKNLLMTLMFPVCFLMLFCRNNRTSYDVATKSIVVEENPTPVLRRL